MDWNAVQSWFDRSEKFCTRAHHIGEAQFVILDSPVEWELLIPGFDALRDEYRRLTENARECSFIAQELMGE